MPLIYRNPVKMEARRAARPDHLASGDQLNKTLGRTICQQGLAPSLDAKVNYFTRKHAALKAIYFRQIYGRDYWTGESRRPRAPR